jgi:uncharacterized protein (TIGR00369 family)
MSAAAQPRPEIRYGLTPAHELAGLSGLEFLQGLIEGRFPAPPVSQTAGFHIVEAREGEVVFEGEPTASFLNPLGTIHGGWTATLLDTVMACAVHTTLKPGSSYTTAEFKTHLVRPILPGMGLLRAEGRIIHSGSRIATSEGRILDGAGKLLAHGTETCVIFEPRAKS